MNRRIWSTMCLMTLLMAAAAWGQSGNEDATTLPALSDEFLTAVDTSGTDGPLQGIKQQLRSEFAQFVVAEIHTFFVDLRTSLGLPAEPTDPTTDPLAIVETVIIDMVENKLTN